MEHPRAGDGPERSSPGTGATGPGGALRIELIGCTSAGKTTLADAMVRAAVRGGVSATRSDPLILRRVHADRVTNEFLRRRLVESASLPACLFSWRRHGAFCRLVIRAASHAPGSWAYRASVARIALNKVGVHELVRRLGEPGQVVVMDNEGILQAAHNLFAHAEGSADPRDIVAFARLAPLPDVAVYLREDESILVERTIRRGHRRLPSPAAARVETFVRQAIATFDTLLREPAVADRLLVVEGPSVRTASAARPGSPDLLRARELVLDGIRELVEAGDAGPERRRAQGAT